MNKTAKTVLIIVLAVGGAVFLLFMAVVVLGIIAAIAIPHFLKHQSTADSETIARSLLQSMQSASAIYVAQQQVPPDTFSNFLVIDQYVDNPAHTLTLENVKDLINEPDNQLVLESNEFHMVFNDGYEVIYYLNGTDITADFKP